MLSITSVQLDAWFAGIFLPMARLLGLFAAVPALGGLAVSTGLRLGLGLAVALALVPALPAAPQLPSGNWLALAALARELVLGLAMGMVLRIIFAAARLAGEVIGLQMGLSFTALYDVQTSDGPPATARLLVLLAALVFLGMDGHLMVVDVAARSFEWLPVASGFLASRGLAFVAYHAITIFSAGLLLALPAVAALLIVHITLGILSRAAPQFHLFATGFPVFMATGFAALALSIPVFAPMLSTLVERSLDTVGQLLQALTAI